MKQDISIDAPSQGASAEQEEITHLKAALEAKSKELEKAASDLAAKTSEVHQALTELHQLDEYTKTIEDACRNMQREMTELAGRVAEPCEFCGRVRSQQVQGAETS
jgi:chromosome segregation ATPase